MSMCLARITAPCMSQHRIWVRKGIFAISTAAFGEVSKVYADGSAESLLNVAGGKIVFKNHRLNCSNADIYQMKGESGQAGRH